jgi:cytochrome c oxidase subunit 3
MDLFDDKNQKVPGAGRIGMLLFLLALTMLFGSGVVGYLVVRGRAAQWPPAGMPDLPTGGLWISTLIILVSALALESGYKALRAGRQTAFRNGILIATILGAAFVVNQMLNWMGIEARIAGKRDVYVFTFYMLTGLHVLHVLGGLLPLGIVTRRAFGGSYSPTARAGVDYCRMYWHFLGAVWLVLFILLLALS